MILHSVPQTLLYTWPSSSLPISLAAPSPSISVNPIPQAPTHNMTTRSQTSSLTPKNFSDYKLFSTSKYPILMLHNVLKEPEPTSYRKAATDPR